MQQLKNKASEETKHTKKDVREMWGAFNVANGNYSIDIYMQGYSIRKHLMCQNINRRHYQITILLKPIHRAFHANAFKRHVSKTLCQGEYGEHNCVRCISHSIICQAIMASYSRREALHPLSMTTVYVWRVDKTRGTALARQHRRKSTLD